MAAPVGSRPAAGKRFSGRAPHATRAAMSRADLSASPPQRFASALAVVLLHIAAAAGLIRAFAPDLARTVVERTLASVTVLAPEPTPAPPPAPPTPSGAPPAASGAQGAAGRRAVPREVLALPPRIPLATAPAPAATSTGSANQAGATDSGSGTEAGGSGNGTGSGGEGQGQGGGGGRLAKIAGDISSAKDYPIASRDLRIGDHVTIWLSVGPDGRPAGCRIVRASRDPAADATTCRLAQQRFRFRPATDANGRPVSGTYAWTQRWFYKE